MRRWLLLALLFAAGPAAAQMAGAPIVQNGGGGGGGGSTTPGGLSGQIQYNNAGSFGGFTMSGDCTFAVPGITCTKTNGSAFAPSATTDTTNASNITSGSLALGRITALGADSLLGNFTAGSAAPTGGALTNCSGASSALTYNTTTHTFGCNTISGSGTVNSGTAGQLAGYATSGTAVSGVALASTLSYTSGTLSTVVPNSTKTANYTVAAADMGGTVNLGGTGATLTVPAISSTVLAQGMSVCYASQATGNWTISSAPTINGLNSTTVPPGGAACLVSNGTSLDLQPGAQLPTATSIGGVMSLTCGAGNFVNGIGTNGQPACGTPAGGGNVTAVGTLTSGQITIGQGAQSVAVDTNASLSAGALSLGASGTLGQITFGNVTSGTINVQPVTGALGTVNIKLPATSGNLITTGDSGTVTGTMIASGVALAGSPTTTTQAANDNSTKIATTAYVDRPVPTNSGTTHTFAGKSDIFICTGACTLTVPVPSAGVQYCAMNNVGVSTAITFSAIGSSAAYGKTDQSAYGTAGTGTAVSSGAVGDKLCLIGLDSTHYNVASFNGTWAMN